AWRWPPGAVIHPPGQQRRCIRPTLRSPPYPGGRPARQNAARQIADPYRFAGLAGRIVTPSGLQLVSWRPVRTCGQPRRRAPAQYADPAIACFSMHLLDIVSIFNKVKREHMTSMTRQYSSATSRARSAVDKTADFWAQGARTLTDRLPGLPQIDLIPAVERYFDLVQQTVDINRRLTIKWAEAAGDIVRDKAESAERTAREQAEQAEKERAREARFAERQQARQAHDKARERYEGLTKAELSDQLAKRQLPKSGNVDELIERLVEADSK